MASTTAPSRLKAAERRQQVLDYRRAGYSYPQIARLVGIDVATAYYHVSRRLRELNQSCTERAEEVLALELERLDAQEQRLQEAIRSLTPAQVHLLPKFEDSLLKVSVQRCKLLGLTAPQPVNQVVVNQSSVELTLQNPAIQQLARQALSEIEGREVEVIDANPVG